MFFFFGKASHHPGLLASLQPRVGSLQLMAFPKAKIAFEMEICECDGHIVHKFSQRRLTADWLAPRESDCSRTHSEVSLVTGYQVTSRPSYRFSRYSKWLDTSRTVHQYRIVYLLVLMELVIPLSSVLKDTDHYPTEQEILRILQNWRFYCCIHKRSTKRF